MQHKKKILKRNENNITLTKANAPVSQTSSKRLILTIQTYWIKDKKPKIKLGEFQEEIHKHLCQLVLI